MEFSEKLQKEPENPVFVKEYCEHLYAIKDYRSLEQMFTKYLKKSYSLGIWHIYIDYVKKVSQKKFQAHEAYELVLSQFEHYWDAHDIYRSYIEELGRIEDEQQRIGKIRTAYMRALQTPMRGLGDLWRDFEGFELELNKITGKKIIGDTLPLFQNSFQQYQAMLPLLRDWSIESAAKLIDLEGENGLKASDAVHASRMGFIHKFVLDAFYYSEEAYFFYSEYLVARGQKSAAREVLHRGMRANKGPFLPLYYALLMDDESMYHDLRKRCAIEADGSTRSLDLVDINHLNFTLKKKGLEAFRKLFVELSAGDVGPHVYIYGAHVEFYLTGSRITPYNVFSAGLLKHPASTLLKQEFFLFLLRIGDEENARALFKRLDKTNKMWDAMLEYEFAVGSMELFRELTEQKMQASERSRILKALPEIEPRKKTAGILGKYFCFLDSFYFLGLAMDESNPLEDFMVQLPHIEPCNDVLSNLNLDRLIKFLQDLQMPS
jgi:cleavage stimulation factor subunit 3